MRLLPDRSVNGLATDTGEICITQGLFDTFRRGEVTARELVRKSFTDFELATQSRNDLQVLRLVLTGRRERVPLIRGHLGNAIYTARVIFGREALEILDTMIAHLDSAAGPGGAQDARPGSGHGQA